MNKFLIFALFASATSGVKLGVHVHHKEHAKRSNAEEIAQATMAAISTDGNMTINLDEVYAYTADALSAYSGLTPAQRREEYRRMEEFFNACDANGNGEVTVAELTAELERQLS